MAPTSFSLPPSTSPQVVRAFAAWTGLCAGRFAPTRRDIDPSVFGRLLSNIVLFDVRRDPLDFRYRLVGSTVRERARANYTGLWMSALEHQQPTTAFFANYASVVDGRTPLFGDVSYIGPDKLVRHVQHLLLPLSDDRETVTGVLTFVEYESGGRRP